jgi:hypothetical protein
MLCEFAVAPHGFGVNLEKDPIYVNGKNIVRRTQARKTEKPPAQQTAFYKQQTRLIKF